MSDLCGYSNVTTETVSALERIVGKEHVTTSKPILMSYVARGIMGLESTAPEVVVRPKEVEEIRDILVLANAGRIPITPMSGGLSGGFACPLKEPGGILLDLSRMNRIIDVDTDCRYMVVEPGVTSGAAWTYFRKNYPEWAPPVPDGAPPAATILGDALERGFSLVTNRYGPQADMILGMEVVLPSGEVFKTGSWALPGAKPFYRWGIGPDLSGLFLGAQGTLGVVTKLAIKIVPHPRHKDLIAFGFESQDDMVNATLNVLKTEVCVLVQCGNWWLVPTRMASQMEIPSAREFWKKQGIPEWFSNFEIWGRDEEDLNNQRKVVYQTIEELKEKGIRAEEWKLHPKQKASRMLKPNKIAIPYALFKGSFLFITWYTPWRDAAEFCRIAQEKMEKYGIPPVLWVASIEHGREAICMPIVCFDPAKPEDLQKVQEFNKETTGIFLDKGWLNYRPDPYIHAPEMYSRAKAYFEILKKIKRLLDPKGIMHPGRLGLMAGGF